MTAPATVELTHLECGHCLNLAGIAEQGQPMRPRRFPNVVTLIRHPEQGFTLFDTGYAPRTLAAFRRWPGWVYGAVTPVRLPAGESAVERLRALGLTPADVRHVVLSHLHADHVSGVHDFPDATWWMDAAEVDAMFAHDGLAAVRRGIVPALRPPRERLTPFTWTPAPPHLAPHRRACDFLGDGSLWIIPSPGHTPGSVAAVARTASGPVLLAGDTAWSERALREGGEPHRLGQVAVHDMATARASAQAWRDWLAAHPDARVVCSHDPL